MNISAPGSIKYLPELFLLSYHESLGSHPFCDFSKIRFFQSCTELLFAGIFLLGSVSINPGRSFKGAIEIMGRLPVTCVMIVCILIAQPPSLLSLKISLSGKLSFSVMPSGGTPPYTI